MRSYVRLTGILLIVCVFAAAILGVTNAVTSERIIEEAIKADNKARKEVLAEATEFIKVEDNTIEKILEKLEYDIIDEVFEGREGEQIVGYTIKVTPTGYGGVMEIIVGVNKDGKVSGIKVGNNGETPGLGKNAATPKFQDQFQGKDWESGVNVIKNGTPEDDEILSIAGATMTSDAVADGVNKALDLAKELFNI